jgi:uncharacterized protein (TIRG00374 family)
VKKINLKQLTKLIPLFGIILFIYILGDIGIEKIANSFIQIKIQYLIIAIILFFPRFSLFAYSWHYLCKKQKMNPGYFFLFKIYLIGLFYGNVVPGGFGGHIRIFYLRNKTKASIEKCLVNSVIDYSLVPGLFLSLIGSIFLFEKAPELFPILLFFFCLNTIAFVALLQKRSGSKLFNFFIKRFIPKKFKDKISQSVDALYEDIPRLRDLIVPSLINILIRIITATGFFIIAQSFSINVPYIDFIFIDVIAVIVVGILPISVGGLGIREGMYVYLLGMYGVPPDIAFTISLSGYIVKMLVPSIIGLLLTFKKEFRLDKVFIRAKD